MRRRELSATWKLDVQTSRTKMLNILLRDLQHPESLQDETYLPD
jgi:hypothetical protein